MPNMNGTYRINGNMYAHVDDTEIRYTDFLGNTKCVAPKSVLLNTLDKFSHNIKRASITGKVTPVSLAVASIIS